MVCGSEVEADTSLSGVGCGHCGLEIAVPYRTGEERYDEANAYRQNGEFRMAEAVYDEILWEYSKDAEAYFGRFLSRYGVCYRKNPFSGKWEPECTSPLQMPVMEDGDYLRAMEFSGPVKRGVYKQIAEEIDRACQNGGGLNGQEFLFCHRLNEEQRAQLEKELLGERTAGQEKSGGQSGQKQEKSEGGPGQKQTKQEKPDTGGKSTGTGGWQAEKQKSQKRGEPAQETDKQESDWQEKKVQILSEADKAKVAVLEKRIQGLEKAIQMKQSGWLKWEQWGKNVYLVLGAIFLAGGVFLFLIGLDDVSSDLVFWGCMSGLFSLFFFFFCTPIGEKLTFEDNIKRMEKNIKKLKEQIRRIQYPDDERNG